jgi:hypothetical protein
MSQVDVKIGEDVPATLVYYHQPFERETLTDPEVPESYELEQVLVGGIDIMSLLGDEMYGEIEEKLQAGDYRDDSPHDDPRDEG